MTYITVPTVPITTVHLTSGPADRMIVRQVKAHGTIYMPTLYQARSQV